MVVVCLKLLIFDEPNVSGKSFISTIFLICEDVKLPGKLFKSTFPVVLVVVVVVVCLKLLIFDDPNVSGKSFIFIILFICSEVKFDGKLFKSIFPVASVFVVVVICFKLLLSLVLDLIFSVALVTVVTFVVSGC